MNSLPRRDEIPLMRPLLPSAEQLLPYLQRIDAAAWYTNFGPLEQELAHALSQEQVLRHGRPVHSVLVCNATQALELVIAALELKPGSRIAVPAFTFLATATAVERSGHIPVALDVDADSWLLTPAQLPASPGSEGIAAVIPVAAFGMPQNAQVWSEWSREHGIPVIIDAASAFGAQASAEGITVVFSLHATKPLSAGEGGLIVTEDAILAHRFKLMTNFGIGLDRPGFSTNCKLSEYHAAVGLAHLAHWPQQTAQRRELFARYTAHLREVVGPRIVFQSSAGLYAPSVMPIQLASAQARAKIERACSTRHIGTRKWYQPLIHQQPGLICVERLGPIPHAEHLAETLLGLPFHLGITNTDIQRIAVVCRLAVLERPSTAKKKQSKNEPNSLLFSVAASKAAAR